MANYYSTTTNPQTNALSNVSSVDTRLPKPKGWFANLFSKPALSRGAFPTRGTAQGGGGGGSYGGQTDFSGKYGTNQNYAGTGGMNYATPQGQGGIISTPTRTPVTPITPQAPVAPGLNLTPQGNAQRVIQAGQQTPWEQAAAENVANAKGMQNFGQFAPNAEAPFYAGADRQQMESLITRPDLVARGGPMGDLYNKFANLYGTQSNVGLQAAQTAAQRGLDASQGVLSASLPGQVGLTSSLYNPLGGAGAVQGLGDRALQAGQVSSLGNIVQKYNDLQPVTQSIHGIEGLIKNVLGQSDINAFDVNAINSAVNRLRSNVSDPNYNIFKNYITSLGSLYSSYLARNGGETETTRQMASSLIDGTASAGTISQVLNALKAESDIVSNAYYNQTQNIQGSLNQGTGVNPPQGGGGYNDTWSSFGF